MRSGLVVIAIAAFAVGGGASHVAPPARNPVSHSVLVAPAAIAAPRSPEIAVPAPSPLEVRVTAAGRPVAAAEVRIADGSESAPRIVTTDADGIARVSGLGSGPYGGGAVS